LLRDLVMSKVLVSTKIEGIYNDDWKNIRVLPYDKNQLPNQIFESQGMPSIMGYFILGS
jgi:hypothetical protein